MTEQMSRFGSDASLAATKQLARAVRTQATVLSIADVFLVLTVLFVGVALLTPIMRKPKMAFGPSGGGGH